MLPPLKNNTLEEDQRVDNKHMAEIVEPKQLAV
jgi:hypothetical protein